MKRATSLLGIIFSLSLIVLMTGCNSSVEKIIPSPNKIVIYFDNKSKEIKPEDTSFEKIVDLTNKRIDVSEISTIKDGVNEEYVNELKQEKLSIEFIYEKEQEMSLKGTTFKAIKYYKLFFPLANKGEKYDKSSIVACFQYSDIKNYTDSSRGPLKNSPELIKLVESEAK